jgi:hypothetical protein
MFSAEELARLEARLQDALVCGDEPDLEVLGYGEISSVVAWSVGEECFACKRVPDFDSRERFGRYRAQFERYLAELGKAGIEPVPSALEVIEKEGALAVWCLQPRLPGDALLPRVMREVPVQRARELFEALCDRLLGAVGPRLGVDGQLSNWVWLHGRLAFLDVTTPMLRDAAGNDELDADLFLASLPWALRALVKRFMLRDILDKYYEPRGVVLDLLGNLHKEGLDQLIAPALEVANRHFPDRPLSDDELHRYYAADARTWRLLQRLRRLDRQWQRRVRRRPYPFLLPGDIAR